MATATTTPAVSAPMDAIWKPKYNPWLIALTVTLASFMEVLDTSIANVSLPHIAGSLAASQDESTWVLTSYLVSNAIVLPLSGWLSVVLGRKRFYMICVLLFTLSSFLCGLAPSLGLLVFFRILQGVGGGGLQPSEQAILADTFPPQKRGMAFAIYGIAVVTAPAIGPTLGGWITDNFDWRWIFFINIPVGILSLFLTSFMVQDPPYLVEETAKKRAFGLKVDYWGISLVAIGLGFLQVVLDKGERDDWLSSDFIRICLVLAIGGLVMAVWWELRQEHPVVDLSLLKERNFAIAGFLMFMVGVVLLGSTVLLPLYLQNVLGYTAMQAGLVLSPGGVAIILLLPFVGILLGKMEAKWLIIFGLMITSAGLLNMTGFNTNMDFATAMWARVFQAAGLAFLFVPINTSAYAFVPPTKNNSASALINLARNIGGSVGISAVVTLLARRTQFHQARLTEALNGFNPVTQQAFDNAQRAIIQSGVPASAAGAKAYALLSMNLLRQASTLAYVDCFYVLAVVFAALIPLIFLMKKSRPGSGIAVH